MVGGGDTLVPPGVVTRTLTVPAACAGAVALICVPAGCPVDAGFSEKVVAATVPNNTLVAPVNVVPVIVILVAFGPLRRRDLADDGVRLGDLDRQRLGGICSVGGGVGVDDLHREKRRSRPWWVCPR